MIMTTARAERKIRLTAALFASAAAIAIAQPAAAQRVWDGEVSEDWTNPENWGGNVLPTENSGVFINATSSGRQPVLSGEGTVATINNLSVGQANTGSLVVRDGAVLNIGRTGFGFSLAVGGLADNASSGLVTSGFGNGTLTITGAGSRVNADNLVMGNGFRPTGATPGGPVGLVEVLNGGVLNLRTGMTLGTIAPGRGILRVVGPGSALEVGVVAVVESAGSRVEILDGARVAPIGPTDWTVSVVNGVRIAGAGTVADLGGTLRIFSGNASFDNAAVIVEDGATLRSARISAAGDTNRGRDSGSIIVRSGGRIITSLIDLGFNASRGAVLVDGGSLEVAGEVLVGLGSGVANSQVVVRGGGSISVGRMQTVAPNSEIVLGGLEADGPSAVARYDVPNLSIFTGSRLLLNHSGAPLTLNSAISGGGLIQHLSGTTIFTGTSSGFSGETRLTGGAIIVNGTLGTGGHRLNLSDGSLLGGSGTVVGAVTIADGRIAPGNSAGKLTIAGNLVLGADSIIDFELGRPDGTAGVDSDLITVNGSLTLGGTLNIINIGGFGAGLYRLIDYTGTLTDNGAVLGALPEGFSLDDVTLQTATARQVNLMVAAPAPSAFFLWDGANDVANNAVDGGSGTWTTTATNWTVTNGATNGAYTPEAMLIFSGLASVAEETAPTAFAAASTASGSFVTIDNGPGQVAISGGLQFAIDGYTITGGALRLDTDAPMTFRIGDGTAQGAQINTAIASALIGTGGVLKTDLGRLILTGMNTYTGGTTVAQGTLAGNTVSLQGAIEIGTDGTLVFDQAEAGTFAGTLTGGGLVEKRGAGALTLSGNSSGLTGRLDVLAGALNLTGVLGSTESLLAIAAGASLTGNGTAGSLDLSGTLAPSPGTATFNVGGNVTFRAGSTYAVDLRANGATDRLVAGGSITLQGGTVAITALDPELDYTDGNIFVIAQAGTGLTGTFAGLTENSAFLDFRLGYDATRAFITVDVIRTFPDVAQTANQLAAAAALRDLTRAPGSDALAVYNQILLLGEGPARAAFDFASGEIYADVVAGEQRAALARGAGLLRRAMTPGSEGWQAWLGGTLERVRVSDDGNGARFTRNGEDFELGLEYHGEDDRWAAGVSGGYLSSSVANAVRLSATDSDGWFIGGFARHGSYGKGVTAGLAVVHADQSGSAQRVIRVGPITRTATTGIDMRVTSVTADLRFGFGSDSLTFGPAVSIDHASAKLQGFAEAGAGALNLSSDGVSDKWTRYGLGGFLAWRGDTGRMVLDVRYAIDNDDVAADVQLAGSPRAHTVLAARPGENGVAFAAAGSLDAAKNLTIGVDGSALIVSGGHSATATAFLRWVF